MENAMRTEYIMLANELATKEPSHLKAVIGLDGFVDEILHVVATRKNAHSYERLRSMKAYGEKIVQAAGLSTNIEMVKIKEKLGGNGPILSHALATYGISTTCIGALGYPYLDKVFKPMEKICSLLSVCNPGHTDAIEFDDGKIIVGKHETLKDISWENIKQMIGLEKLMQLIQDAALLGLENWTMLPHMSDIWRGLLSEVLPHIVRGTEKKYVFFDLADPEKRTPEDILEALDLIQRFEGTFSVILGLNLKEAAEVAAVLGYAPSHAKNLQTLNLEALVKFIAEKLKIYSVVVHPTHEAATVIGNRYFHVKGPYTASPKLTTGAGDNFNAGFCLGQMLALTPEASLLLGVATSGYYVRNAKSPCFKELIEFLKLWSQEHI